MTLDELIGFLVLVKKNLKVGDAKITELDIFKEEGSQAFLMRTEDLILKETFPRKGQLKCWKLKKKSAKNAPA